MVCNSTSRKTKRAKTKAPASSIAVASTASTTTSVPAPELATRTRRRTRSSILLLRVGGALLQSSRPRLPRKALAKSGGEGNGSEDNEEEEGEEGSEGDDEGIDGDYEEEERDGGVKANEDVNLKDVNIDQTQGINAAAVKEEIYYSDSDPEATIPDIYGDDSDDESEDDDATGGDALPDLLADETYHPEHPTVRKHINELFEKTLTASVNPPINAPQLVDRLVRQHLPQFWRHRIQDTKLNKHKNMKCPNDRPRSLAILSTCVECGFKFYKQPLYDETQRERHCQRWKRDQDTNTKPRTGREPSRKRKPLFGAEYFRRRQGMSSSPTPLSGPGAHDNSGLTATELDNILNNNRRSTRFDGNLDHIGLKEEKHDEDCFHNRASAKSNAKKLYLGWGLVLGHDHVTTPVSRKVSLSSSYSAASTSTDTTSTSRSSPPAISTSLADPLIDDEAPPVLPDSDCLLYPSRSLMASFCHLIPRGLVLSTNMLRKLFTYFVWHPWFDCHLQAITIRRAYSELWPLFLLMDEDEEVEDEEEAEFRKQMNALTRATRQAAQERKRLEMQANPQTGSKRKANDMTGCRKKTKHNDGNGANKKDKGKRKRKAKKGRLVADEDDASPPKVRKPRTVEELAEFERTRLISLQARFTTSFKNGLSIHGIHSASFYPSMNTRARMARQKRRGWTLFWALPHSLVPGSIPSRPYIIEDDNDGEGYNRLDCNEKELFARRKVHCYIADVDEKARTTASGIVHPKTLFPELSENAILRLTNHQLTQPNCADALSRLAVRLYSWFRRAHRRRVRQGFILPEYMEIRPPKIKPKRKTKTQPKPMPKCKPRPRARVMAKTKTKANTGTLNDMLVPDSIPEEQAAIVDIEDEESINTVELVNYLTRPRNGVLVPGGNSAFSSAQRSLTGMVRRQSPRGLSRRLDMQAFDASSSPWTTASSTAERVCRSETFMTNLTSLAEHNANSAAQTTLGYHDERQLFGLMFDDMLDNPLEHSDSYGWSLEYRAESAIPNDLTTIDLGEIEVDMGCFEDGQGISNEIISMFSDEHNGEDRAAKE
ncbi:hypothetical protein BGZ68_010911 [Mortierella alpina]|nr:hypothetical protein BGZ68_010911 [Mortierella alpina]